MKDEAMQEFVILTGFGRRVIPEFDRLIAEAIAEGAVLEWPPLVVPRGFLGWRVLCMAVLRHPDIEAGGVAARQALAA